MRIVSLTGSTSLSHDGCEYTADDWADGTFDVPEDVGLELVAFAGLWVESDVHWPAPEDPPRGGEVVEAGPVGASTDPAKTARETAK